VNDRHETGSRDAGGAIRSVRVRVEGIVQGVGFRPFVYALAGRLGLGGTVSNDARGVIVEAEGPSERVDRLIESLAKEAPPLAHVERVTWEEIPPFGAAGFAIAETDRQGSRDTLISPDMATCADCVNELFDPGNRRFRYPFVNCTNCGPRFTIVRDVPYDRPFTTMADFRMCADCAREYRDPGDRRFHAQPIACAACGPALTLRNGEGEPVPGDPIEGALRALADGAIVALKGIGGYHLAAGAENAGAVARLRSLKHREDKPFAIMVRDIDAARAVAEVGKTEEALLASPRAPIVLLPRRGGAELAPTIAPGNRSLGVMLPYSPLHHLLARGAAGPIVLTSGNVSDEPIAYRDGDAAERLRPIASFFLTHDREIHVRTDDSVFRAFRGRPFPVRRSRGYAPAPVSLPRPLARPVLACGAGLKNTICVARGSHAFVSHHIGDLENESSMLSFLQAIGHYERLFAVRPEIVAHDLHPEYLSTKWALEQEGVELAGVQHHHAHIASCLVDNGAEGPVIGVAFDGLGYGSDGTLWGGEFLIADLSGFERAGHLAAVPMPGGDAATREPWRMAASYLDTVYGDAVPELEVARRHASRWETVTQVARRPALSPPTSSAGRLFDAVAALLGIRDVVHYEGQAAVELEQAADPAQSGSWEASISRDSGPFRIHGADLVRSAADALLRGESVPAIAGRFHHSVARLIVDGARLARESSGLETVALSGGVFQNMLLLERAVAGLEGDGFRVLVHRQVPCNDGGVSLGQAAIAGFRELRRDPHLAPTGPPSNPAR